MFGTHAAWIPTDATDLALTDAMMDAWAAFARTGDPGAPGGVGWPEFSQAGRVLVLGDAIATAEPMDDDLCAVLDATLLAQEGESE